MIEDPLALLGQIDSRKQSVGFDLGQWIPGYAHRSGDNFDDEMGVPRRDTDFHKIAPRLLSNVSHYIDLENNILVESLHHDVAIIEAYLSESASDKISRDSSMDDRFLMLVRSSELPGHAQLPWQQYLAMRAFIYLDQACFFIRQDDGVFGEYDPLVDAPALDEALVLLCYAQEFLTHARWCSVGRELIGESFHDVEAIQRDARREQASKAAKKGHFQKNEIKRRCQEYYCAHGSGVSKAQCVRTFIETLDEKERRLFSPSNINRTLQDCLKGF